MNTLKKTFCSVGGWKHLALLCALSLLLTAAVGSSLAFIVTKTPSLYNLFVSGVDPTGDLVLRKTVEHPFGDGYVIPDGIEFVFEVDLGAENAGKTFDGRTADENGVLTVTVRANSAVTVHDLPAGTAVTVTEQTAGPGFSVRDGLASKEVMIEKGAESSVEFINTYSPEKVPVPALSVGGVKTLSGRDWQEGDSFTFQLALLENGAWTALGTDTAAYRLVETEDPEQPGQTVWAPEPDFDRFDLTGALQSVSFDHAGIYSFRLTELEGSVGGVAYDNSERYFDVLVGDADMDGYLEIQSVTASSANTQVAWDEAAEGWSVETVFENRYAPAGSAGADIRIKKTLVDSSGQNKAPAGFAFGLYDENGVLLQTSEPTSAAGETGIHLIYEPADAGKTFTYVLKEINGGQSIDGMAYDGTEIPLQVSVEDNLDGTVSALIYDAREAGTEIPGDASGSYDAEFTNLYDPQDVSVSIGGDKDLSGRAMKAGEFRFNLYQTGPDFALAENAQPVSSVCNSDGEGSFRFDDLTFSAVGTYYYVAAEDASAPLGGVGYDSARYLVTVSVTDAGGALAADVRVADETGEESGIKFYNTYTAARTTVTLGGEKILNGADLTEGMFTFLLYEADESYAAQGEAIRTAANRGDGTFSFGALTFENAGTYYYVIAEDSSEQAEGITYDGTVYGVLVTVWDDGNGQLVAESLTTMPGGEQVDAVRFENTYTPAPPDDGDGQDGKDNVVGSDTEEDDVSSTSPAPGTKTGDDSHALPYIVLLIVSASLLVLLLVIGKRTARRKRRD